MSKVNTEKGKYHLILEVEGNPLSVEEIDQHWDNLRLLLVSETRIPATDTKDQVWRYVFRTSKTYGVCR